MSGGRIKRIEYSTKYLRSFKKLPGRLKHKALEKERLFRSNPFDARLGSHKLSGKFQGYWSYSVDYKSRVIFRFINGNSVLFFDVGPHPIYRSGE